jgi:hypothetical protein
MGVSVLAVLLVVLWPGQAAAERQIKAFAGSTWGGSSTFVDVEQAAGSPNVVFGVSGLWLGDVFGIEGEVSRAPGFFQRGFFRSGDTPVPPGGSADRQFGSSVTTATGSVVIAAHRRLTEYTLRPYFVAGGGLMRVVIDDLGVLPVESTIGAVAIGGGVTGFLSERTGLSWDVRRFWSVRGPDRELGFSIGPEQLSFWRASMAIAFRW